MGLIDWLVHRWWAWKNSAALDALDAQAAFLEAESARIDARMEEAFGPDWREQAEERLKRVMSCTFTTE